jgi:hypothetical protein
VRIGRVVRRAIITLTACLVIGCGSRALAPKDEAGAAGAGGGAAALADAAAGAGDAGADSPKPSCGGDLVGTWAVAQDNLPPPTPGPSVNACLDLQLGAGGVTWIPPYGPVREIAIHFMKSGAFDVDDLRRGPAMVHYGASCLASPAGTVTCDELATELGVYGLDTGEYQRATCTSASSGGCDCTLELSIVLGASGTWSSSGGVATFVNGSSNQATTSAYCVDGAGLRFDPAVETVLPGGSGFAFQPVDCADGKQGLFEEGVDCGWACANLCP